MKWPEIFTNENFEYQEFDESERFITAIADGLSGWALCMSGGMEIPKNFGRGMAKILKIVGTVTPDSLMAASNKLIEERDKE